MNEYLLLSAVLTLMVLTVIGEKSAVEDSLRQTSHLVKSTSSGVPMANQVALAAHKEVEVSLAMPARAHSPQRQRIVIKHKAGQVCNFVLLMSRPLRWQKLQLLLIMCQHTCHLH